MIEINNESKKPIWAMACRSKMSGNLYIHVGLKKKELHPGKMERVEPLYYALLEINDVDG